MADPKRRFARADDLGAPDLWEEIRRRSTDPRSLPPERVRVSAGRRIAIAVVALAVFTGSAVFAWRALSPNASRVAEPEPSVSPEPGPLDDLPAGWTELPPPPEVRTGAATAWTGTELIVWGGYVYTGFSDEEALGGGYAFDPFSGASFPLPAAPLEARILPATAWTGSEVIVWGGAGHAGSVAGPFDDGAAYDPAAGTWRSLPDPPVDARMPFSVWTGSELIVWGSRSCDGPRVDGAAYDPGTDTWRSIADAPLELTEGTAVWTGEEMIVVGVTLRGCNFAETETAIGAAYDPEADAWRRIPDSMLSPQASTAAWNGTEVIAWDYLNRSQTYDPVGDRWRPLQRVPLAEYECVPSSVGISDGFVFGDYCGLTTIYDPMQDAWQDISREGVAGWGFELVAAGPAALALGRDVETGRQVLLAYRPEPSASPSAPPAAEPTPFVPEVVLDGGLARVDVTFPDGSAATLVYPAELELASSGIQPDVSYLWIDDPPPRHPIVFLHGPPGVEADLVEGEPRAILPLPDGGEATVWVASRSQFTRHREIGWWLVYRTPTWTILASLQVETDAETLASALSVADAETGFPVVTTTDPLALAEYHGESEGPVLTLADTNATPDLVSSLEGTIFLSPDGCTGGPEFDPEQLDYYGSNCLGDGEVFASIYGDKDFIRAVLDGLRVESFNPAPV